MAITNYDYRRAQTHESGMPEFNLTVRLTTKIKIYTPQEIVKIFYTNSDNN